MTIDVGAHLKAVRTMYGLSQRELAKRAGVTNGTISLIEQNRVSPSEYFIDSAQMTSRMPASKSANQAVEAVIGSSR